MDVIYLNGASGSGKTSLSRELQDQLSDYYLHIGIDTFISMMPARSNSWDKLTNADGFSWKEVELPNGQTGMRVVAGSYGKEVYQAFQEVVLTLLSGGQKLIIDDVANGLEEVIVWKQILKAYSSCFIGVFCSIESLKEREQKRGDRKIGSSIEQFYRVHQGINYDFSVDTDRNSPKEGAKLIVDFVSHVKHKK
ncbi:MAG: chloramphenicol phosphotransferase CPT family protein [Anaerolineae bacterium]